MSEMIKPIWLKEEGDSTQKVAPKTLIDLVYNTDGTKFKDSLPTEDGQTIVKNDKKISVSEDIIQYGQYGYNFNLLSFEDAEITKNGITVKVENDVWTFSGQGTTDTKTWTSFDFTQYMKTQLPLGDYVFRFERLSDSGDFPVTTIGNFYQDKSTSSGMYITNTSGIIDRPKQSVVDRWVFGNNIDTTINYGEISFRIWCNEAQYKTEYQKYGEVVDGFKINDSVTFPRLEKIAKDSLEKLSVLVLENKEDIEQIKKNNIIFDAMPSLDVLFSLPKESIFSTIGYYDKTDCAGSTYFITSDWLAYAQKLTDDSGAVRYIKDLSEFNENKINLLHYGLKRVKENAVLTDEQKQEYGDINNAVFDSFPYFYTSSPIIYIPVGRYYFSNPINVKQIASSNQAILVGDGSFGRTTTDGRGATILDFYNLEDGDIAVTVERGGLRNISIVGEQYDIVFDRTKCITAPNEVMTETYDITTTGLSFKGGTMENISVHGFYTGINIATTNSYNSMIRVTKCHVGVTCGNDNKFVGLYGWNVHTLFVPKNALVTATQIRVDSCVHVVEVATMNGLQLTDVDGDWCTHSVINVKGGTLSNSSLKGIMGRHSCLVAYDTTTETYKKGSEITEDEFTKYGLITLEGNGKIRDCYIECNCSSSNPFDSTSNYKTSPIVLSCGKWSQILRTTIHVNHELFEPNEQFAKDICAFQETNFGFDFTLENGKGMITYVKQDGLFASNPFMYNCEDYTENPIIDFSTEWES